MRLHKCTATKSICSEWRGKIKFNVRVIYGKWERVSDIKYRCNWPCPQDTTVYQWVMQPTSDSGPTLVQTCTRMFHINAIFATYCAQNFNFRSSAFFGIVLFHFGCSCCWFPLHSMLLLLYTSIYESNLCTIYLWSGGYRPCNQRIAVSLLSKRF